MTQDEPTTCPIRFLKTLYGDHLGLNGWRLEVRCIPIDSNKPVVRRFYGTYIEFNKDWSYLDKLNQDKYQVFFGVVLRQQNKEKNEIPDPAMVTCLWADIDVGADKPNKSIAEIHTRLRKLGNKPTVIVESGHGIHAYWILKKARSLRAEEAKKLLRAIAVATDGDLQSAEVARLLRMPGTINWKTDKKNVLQVPDVREVQS